MKKIFIKINLFFLSLLILLTIILSTTGIETAKFNNLISDKINANNQKINLELQKIKFKFDLKNLSLFLETSDPNLEYQNYRMPVQNIKVYLGLLSIFKSEAKINMVNITSKEIEISELKKIVIQMKPSSLTSFINNRIEKGKINTNIEIYLSNNQKMENYIIKGEVKDMVIKLDSDLKLNKTDFDFFADQSDILIKNIRSKSEGVSIDNGSLKIVKGEAVNLEADLNTKIDIKKDSKLKFLPQLRKINIINGETTLNAKLDHFLNITFDKTFKVTDFSYKNKGNVQNLFFKLKKPVSSTFLQEEINTVYIKKTELLFSLNSKKKNNITATGKYSFNNKNFQNYKIENNFFNQNFDLNLNLDFSEIVNIELLNYKKEVNKVAKIFLDIEKNKKFISIKKIDYLEDQNSIVVKDLSFEERDIVSLKNIKVKTYDKDGLKNDFILDFNNIIKVYGDKYDATNLNRLLNQKSKENIFRKINKNIDIDLKKIDTPLSEKISNFKLIGKVEKGKFVKISSKGDFGDDRFLDITLKSNKDGKKYLEVYSDLPQPLLSNYSFFKGLTGGNMTFSSIIQKKNSTSKLIIKNFKIVNAPGVVKLLSLADFGGLADLAEGEGLSFETMEIKMSNNNGFLKLDEIYAVGPSISVLMEGYKEESGLTSLRGTLVPAKNLNKILSKIPVIGNIIIPQEVGEGLFGVSFKMKGMPGKIKTTINPIKTLTPRFITKALEKSKQAK